MKKGKQRPKEKKEMDNQQNFSSSSKLSTQNEVTGDEVEVREPEMKKMNTNDSSDDGQVVVEEKSINDLPPEMRMEILNNVDTPSLFACRLVNREWNEMSSETLRSRPDSEIRFSFTERGFWGNKNKKKIGSLQNFTKCFKESKNCALSYFNFTVYDFSEPSTFLDHKDWIEFLSLFKNKSFKLKIHFFNDIKSYRILTAKLSDLLQNKIPHVEEFGLNFAVKSDSSHLKLFPTTEDEDKSSSSVQLPALKVIHVDYSSFLEYPGIFQDLLIAAVNLKNIQPFFDHAQFDAHSFQFLYSLGKIHCLQTAHIELTPEFLSTVKNITSSPPPFKLKNLRLFMEMILENPSTWTDATSFISNLFESSKSTLTMLSLTPVGFLHGLKFPTFTNLVEMRLFQRSDDESSMPLQMFPRGINSADVFLALRILDPKYMEDWSGAFPQEDSIPRLPSMKSLKATDHGITGSCISKLAVMCPNLKNLKIITQDEESPKMNFLEVGRAIWTQMKQLESLEIDVDVNSPENNSLALDSCFTGISIQNCQRLNEVTEAVNTLNEWGCQFWVPESELIPLREFPSILDMKDLKQLTVYPYCGITLQKRGGFFSKNLTWISREHAFKLMPQLKLVSQRMK